VFPKAAGEPDWEDRLAEELGRHRALFFRVAVKIVRDAATAEDIVQKLAVKALGREKELRRGSALRPWLLRIAINDSFEELRRRKREPAGNSPAVSVALSELKPIGFHLELQESVMKALERLPEQTRTIVVLRRMECLKGREVAKLLECSEKDVSVHLTRGLEILRHALADWNPG
jgi:RNA polymerase sigma-70 factor (ECF subfamily)